MALSEHAKVAESPSGAQPASITKSELTHLSTPHLPEVPLVVIRPSHSWVALNLRDLWAYRELLYFLMWRDVKVRYKQTTLGIVWVLLQPLLTTLIFTVFLGMLARVPSGGVPYPLLVFTGLLPWTFFASALMSGGNSLVGNAHLITKVYFPRLIIPGAAVGARLVDFAIALVMLGGLLIYYRVALTWNALLLPPLVLLMILFSLGSGMLASALNVKYRDIGIALPVLVQLWMFVSPVIYPSGLLPANWKRVYDLNPMVGIIEGFRAALLGQPFNWFALTVSSVVTSALLVYAAYAFRRMEKEFSDIV